MRYLTVLLTLAFFPSFGEAQLDRSLLDGTVTDPAGGRIGGAVVTAIHNATGLERKTET
jgi:hypothetical protein